MNYLHHLSSLELPCHLLPPKKRWHRWPAGRSLDSNAGAADVALSSDFKPLEVPQAQRKPAQHHQHGPSGVQPPPAITEGLD